MTGVPVRMTFVGGHLDVDVDEDELARWTSMIDDEHNGMMPGHLLQLTAMKLRRTAVEVNEAGS